VSDQSGALRTLSADVREGRRQASELTDLALGRIEQHHDLGAVVALDPTAREQARRIDDRPTGPLAGIPVLVKDNTDVAGLVTTHGSRWYADAAPATTDAPVVRRLREAGAVIVGKTNLPEFSIEGFTDNPVFGPTHNPWRRELSPGGSSGGSAAAVAAGLVPFATGTDGGGSVRIPSAWCGLFGFKTTNGVIGRRGVPDWIDFDTDGLMTTSVDDARVLLDVLAGPTPGDPTALPTALPAAAAPTRMIVAERTDDLGPLPAEVATAFARAADALAQLLRLEPEHWAPTDFFPDGSPDNDWFTLATAEHLAALRDDLGRGKVDTDRQVLHPSSQEFFEIGGQISVEDYLAARRRRFRHVRRIDDILGRTTILVTPTVAVAGVPAVGAGGLLPAETYSTAMQNLTGLPAVSLPAGDIDGLPFGLQVTAPRWADRALLDLAALWERAMPWPLTAPGHDDFS